MYSPQPEFFEYLPIRDREVQWGLYVTGLGCCCAPPQSRYPQRTHPAPYQFTWQRGRVLPEYQLVYIVRGEGTFETPLTGVQKVQAGNVILTFPGVWHRYRPSVETGWDDYWFGLGGEEIDRLHRYDIVSERNPVLEIRCPTEVEAQCKSLVERVRAEPHRTHSIAAAALQTLAAALEAAVASSVATVPAPARAAKDELVAKALWFIWNHGQQPINVADVVAQLPVTRRSLERHFCDALGTTILDEILNCRLQRAKHLLTETTLPVGQVAVMSGFSSAQRMNETFQRREGISAWAYRRTHSRPKSY